MSQPDEDGAMSATVATDEKGQRKKTSPDYSLLGRALLAAVATNETADSLCEAKRDREICKHPPLDLEPGLYIVPTPIGNLGDITLRGLMTLASVDAIYCEDTRVSGAMLSRYGIKKQLISCHDHNEGERLAAIEARIVAGEALALISDAGTPLISDPGYKVVRGLCAAGHAVTALPGASAVLTALCMAGLPTDQFLFAGFLPAKAGARQKEIAQLATVSGSLVFYESPHRLADSLAALAAGLGGGRQAAVLRELSKWYEDKRLGTLDELAAHYAQAPDPKGEIVIVVGPGAPKAADDNWDDLLKAALEQQSVRDAVASVVAATGIKKSVVYDRALALQAGLGKDETRHSKS